jgi:hypothetical protein
VRLRLQARTLCFTLLTASVAFGQTNTEQPVKVVTVCDILLDPSNFNGKSIVVLGRLSSSDEGSWLVEDKCDRKVDSKNGTASHIMVWLEQRGRGPSTPPSMPSIDQDSLKAKLEQAGQTTKLGKHIQYQCTISFLEKNAKPECGWPEVNDQWAIVYGRVETVSDGENGFGHLGGAPAQVVVQAPLVSIDKNGHPKRY